jgi:hypothetical protein
MDLFWSENGPNVVAGHTFQRGMKHEASQSDEEVSIICNLEDGGMAMFPATLDTLVCQVDEHEIGQGIDDLGGIVGSIVVLLQSIDCPHKSHVCCYTSSHHCRVDVTGSQNPGWPGGGYGIEGSHEAIMTLVDIIDLAKSEESRSYHGGQVYVQSALYFFSDAVEALHFSAYRW